MSHDWCLRSSLSSNLLAAALVLLAGCSGRSHFADRLFDEGSFVAAERAYLDLLAADRTGDRREETALYHLGLIYSLPTSSRYDPQKASAYLERLLDLSPRSKFALHASLVLTLQSQTNQLRETVAREAERARSLELALARLRDEAARVENEASDRMKQERRLANSISHLRQEIDRLSAELTAREQELERVKQIDLEGPP